MIERQLIGIPVGLWDTIECQQFKKEKKRIEAVLPTYKVGAFCVQNETSLGAKRKKMQLENSDGIDIFHIQAPFEGKYALTDINHELEEVIVLAEQLGLQRPSVVNFHIGVTVDNDEDVDGYISTSERKKDAIAKNVRTLARLANDLELDISIENEPPILIKPVNNAPRPIIFPFGSPHTVREIIREAGEQNIKMAFDIAHWANGQLTREFLSDRGRVERFFPNEDVVKRLFSVFNCEDWDEFEEQQGNFQENLDLADLYHVSNTTGIGAHLTNTEKKEWGGDGTVDGHFDRSVLQKILEGAKHSGKLIVLEVDIDLRNRTLEEPRLFLQWLSSNNH